MPKPSHKIPKKKKNRPAHRPKKVHPGGRPVKYVPEMNMLVYELCAGRGYKRGRLAKSLRIHRDTIYQWEKDYPKFSDSIAKGMDIWNNQRVEKSLLARATGYRYTETTKEPSLLKGGKPGKSLVITKTVRKHVIPDVAAIKHWQVNIDSKRWKDVKEIKHGGSIGLTDIKDEDLDKELSELEGDGKK